MPWVQLNRNRQGTFRRLVRDAAGNPVRDADGNERWLEFPPRTPIQVAPEDVPTIRGDLGKILMPMEMRCGKLVPLQIDVGEVLEAAPESTATQEATQEPVAIPEVSEVEATAQDAPDVNLPDVPDLSEVLAGREAPKPRKPGRS